MLLLCDLSYLVCKSVFTHPHLRAGPQYTGGLFGLVQQLAAAINAYRPADGVLFCLDTPPYKRAALFAQYKANRRQNADPEIRHRIRVSRELGLEFLRVAGIPYWSAPGYEADDLIAACVRRPRDYLPFTPDRIYAYSSDSDLFQLFRPELLPLRLIRGRVGQETYGREEFSAEYGMEAKHWTRVIALVGSHNGVPGIRGIGPVRARQIVAQRERWVQMCEQHPQLRQSERLARLPLDFNLPNRPQFDIQFRMGAALRFLARYQIQSTAAIRSAFTYLEDRQRGLVDGHTTAQSTGERAHRPHLR